MKLVNLLVLPLLLVGCTKPSCEVLGKAFAEKYKVAEQLEVGAAPLIDGGVVLGWVDLNTGIVTALIVATESLKEELNKGLDIPLVEEYQCVDTNKKEWNVQVRQKKVEPKAAKEEGPSI